MNGKAIGQSGLHFWIARFATVVALTLACTLPCRAQAAAPVEHADAAAVLAQSLQELQAQVRELKSTLVEVHQEADRCRHEVESLRGELEATRTRLATYERSARGVDAPRAEPRGDPAPAPQASYPGPDVEQRLAKVEDQQQLLNAKVDDQYQTKVESASKYRVRLSGIALLNVFSNWGRVDNQDVPSVALDRSAAPSGGDFGATVRQSQLGLEVFGPSVRGARTRADLQMDFFGGFPNAPDGVTTGVARLRTATFRLDGKNTSLIAGQDAPFFSPLSPTSLATLGIPALAYAGNLWTWTPQVRLERRIALSDLSTFSVEAGILDPLSGEVPYSEYYRVPEAGERSRQPAYASRLAWRHSAFGQAFVLGAGGYYSRQNYGPGRNVDAWAGTADWTLPLGPYFSLTGEFYRGRGLGGLGAGLGRSVLLSGPLSNPATTVLGLNTVGGWTQLKFQPFEKLEFNAAAGEDQPLAGDFARFPALTLGTYGPATRNQGGFVNFIYRPHSNLLFSVEYRHLRTLELYNARDSADHLNVALGVLF